MTTNAPTPTFVAQRTVGTRSAVINVIVRLVSTTATIKGAASISLLATTLLVLLGASQF